MNKRAVRPVLGQCRSKSMHSPLKLCCSDMHSVSDMHSYTVSDKHSPLKSCCSDEGIIGASLLQPSSLARF